MYVCVNTVAVKINKLDNAILATVYGKTFMVSSFFTHC